MDECAHDIEHVYRVLYNALIIAKDEKDANTDVVTAAALLHDTGRPEQLENPHLCHAQVGAKKAFGFLTANGFDEGFAKHVSDCILSHRFRKDSPPKSIEAKILFDADKLDAVGAIGIARTLVYNGQTKRALYALDENGSPVLREENSDDSFFREYNYKLKKLYDNFYTDKGRAIAEERRKAAEDFFNALCLEIEGPRKQSDIKDFITENINE